MNTVAKVTFEIDSVENMFLVQDEFLNIASENNWVVRGSIKSDFIEDAKKLAKEIAEKNNTSAKLTVYGANERFQFDRSDVKQVFEI